MFKKIFKKEKLIKLEIQESGNIVLNNALEMSAENILEEMVKCKVKTDMAELSRKREVLINLAQYIKENNKKDFECKEECLDLIIESLNDYKELISTKIKKSSENIQFDLLCGEVHVCNKLIKTFSAANGIEIVTIDKDTEIIKEA